MRMQEKASDEDDTAAAKPTRLGTIRSSTPDATSLTSGCSMRTREIGLTAAEETKYQQWHLHR